VAILLIGGSKAGDDRFYEAMVPQNERNAREAIGGQLDIMAHFPEGAVQIPNFSQL
jgi:hypothetical protein